MMLESVRVHRDAALLPAHHDQVDPGRSQRAPVADAQPQLRPLGLRMPGPDTDIAVDAPGGLMADLHDAALAAIILRVLQ
jgi:hypothetical protein